MRIMSAGRAVSSRGRLPASACALLFAEQRAHFRPQHLAELERTEREGEPSLTQVASLNASTPYQYDRFGDAVSLSGGVLAVGAPGQNSPAAGVFTDNGGFDADRTSEGDESLRNHGGVYLFSRGEVDRWVQRAFVKARNPDEEDYFGHALALDGDTLVVSAPGEDSRSFIDGGSERDNGAEDSGAIYTYVAVPFN